MFDEVSVVIFRYGHPGDDSLDLQIILSWPFMECPYQNRLARELEAFIIFHTYRDY